MVDFTLEWVFLCPRCLTAADMPGDCSVCGTHRVGCRPGDLDDPCRRPLIDSQGRIRTRAPRWWLNHTVALLAEILETD